MKILIKNQIYGLALMLALMFTGCDHFEDLNQDPTTSTDMDPNLMLPTIQMQLSGEQFETWRNAMIYGSDWMQLWTAEYATVEYGGKGQKNDVYMSALWDSQYPREVRNIVDMVERTAGNPEQVNINAVSRIMKVYIFSRLTDLYGDLPYSDAGKGYFEGILKPAYDKQEDIYNDFFKELDFAAKALDNSADVVTQDFYFEGDIDQWRKFANSLRLRLAMRLTKVNIDKAKIEAEAAIAGGVMASNADMAVMQHNNAPFGGGGFGGNGMSYTFMSNTPYQSTFRICTTLAKQLVNTADPRITLLGGCYLDEETRTDITAAVLDQLGDYTKMAVMPSFFIWEVTGSPFNVDVDGEETVVPVALQMLQPHVKLTAINAPYIMMSYAEVRLWMAEAAFRGWSTGESAAEHYSAALAAGVLQFTEYGIEVKQVDVDAFVAANPLGVGTELEEINTQVWVNFAMNPQEAYANWRRIGIPSIVYPNRSPDVNESNGVIPRRMQYSLTEYLSNKENLDVAVARITGGDSWNSRVWWDAK